MVSWWDAVTQGGGAGVGLIPMAILTKSFYYLVPEYISSQCLHSSHFLDYRK